MTDSPVPPTTPEPRKARLSLPVLAVAILAGLGLAAGAVYGIGGLPGNLGLQLSGNSPCASGADVAARIKPTIQGEVAGLVPSPQPLSLSQLTFQRADGSPTAIGEWSGRTVLLNLWATWCAPCRLEMPALDKLQAALGSRDFEVVTVDVDTGNQDKPKKFLADIGVKSLEFHADPTLGIFKALQKTGRSRGLPTTMLIDPKGCEIGTMYGPADWSHPDALKLIQAALVK
jgi:thiol-disulfide isomerase/thioredoxin